MQGQACANSTTTAAGPEQYALAKTLTHPRNIHLREDQLVPPLEDWLLTALAPLQLEDTIDAMHGTQKSQARTRHRWS